MSASSDALPANVKKCLSEARNALRLYQDSAIETNYRCFRTPTALTDQDVEYVLRVLHLATKNNGLHDISLQIDICAGEVGGCLHLQKKYPDRRDEIRRAITSLDALIEPKPTTEPVFDIKTTNVLWRD